MALDIKNPPRLNATQTADMAFILLCFFMMVTTMGSEFGLLRVLPPWTTEKSADMINKRNVLEVRISQHNQLMVNKEIMDLTQLREKTMEFFNINNVGDQYPEKEPLEHPLVGTINNNKGAIVSLQNDRATSYKVYIQVQNELAAAINKLRDDFCKDRGWGPYENCTPEQQDLVGNQIYKMAISEAEPREGR